MLRASRDRDFRLHLAGLAVVLAPLVGLGCSGTPSEPGFQTVVLITIDTLRADRIGAYGYPGPTTPFLDTLASEGIVFDNAYSSSSHTAPSHASLFTSLYPEAHGVLKNGARLSPGYFTTLADALAQQGFETAAFTSVQFLEEVAQGFAYVDSSTAVGGEKEFRVAEETISAAIEWLRGRPERGRLFLWLHLFDVHAHARPEGPHQKFLPRIREHMAESSRGYDEYLDRTRLREHLTLRRQAHMLQYDAQLAYVDSEIARFSRAVQEGGTGESTLWVITADHGEGLGNHDFMGHGKNLYNEQLRVPLIVYASPPRWSPSRVGQLVRLVDLYPTILELVDTEVRGEALEGVSLAPLLSSPETTVPIDYVFAQRRPIDDRRTVKGWDPGLVLAAQSLTEKYIYRETEPDEYFDLVSDPNELRDLADQRLPEAERLKRWLLDRHRKLEKQRPPASSEILPEHLEELRALGYVN